MAHVDEWDEYAERELDRVMGGAVAIRHPRHGGAGGEFDTLRGLDRRTRRTLVGARLLTPTGEHPDVAADVICHRVPGCRDTDDAMEWWADNCLAMIRHRRRVAHWQRHHRLAVRNGYRTYWYYRCGRTRISAESGERRKMR